jgi:hypothetical protein
MVHEPSDQGERAMEFSLFLQLLILCFLLLIAYCVLRFALSKQAIVNALLLVAIAWAVIVLVVAIHPIKKPWCKRLLLLLWNAIHLLSDPRSKHRSENLYV